MGRLKGSKNKQNQSENGRLIISTQSTEERLKTLANLIIDRIIEDQANGKLRFKGTK